MLQEGKFQHICAQAVLNRELNGKLKEMVQILFSNLANLKAFYL